MVNVARLTLTLEEMDRSRRCQTQPMQQQRVRLRDLDEQARQEEVAVAVQSVPRVSAASPPAAEVLTWLCCCHLEVELLAPRENQATSHPTLHALTRVEVQCERAKQLGDLHQKKNGEQCVGLPRYHGSGGDDEARVQ